MDQSDNSQGTEAAGQGEESSGNAALDKRLAAGVLKGDSGTDAAQVWISAFLIAALGFIIYLGSFSIPLHGDDLRLFHDSEALLRIVTAPEATKLLPSSPLSAVGLAVGCTLTGGGVDGLHGLSILLHLCCAILVFLISRRLLPPGTPEAISMLAGMVFAAHPLVTGTVNYLAAYPVLQSTFFGLLALMLLLRGADQSNFCLASLAGAMGCFVLAYGSDTSMLLLPVLGLAFIQLRPKGSGNVVYTRTASYALMLCTLMLWVAGHAAGLMSPDSIRHGFGARFGAFLDGLGNLTLSVPWPYHTPLLPEAPGLALALIGVGLLVAAIGLGIALRQQFLLYAGIWVLLTVLSMAAYGPAELTNTPRYLYMPFAGLTLLFPAVLSQLRAPTSLRVGGGVAALVLLVLGVISFQRTETWKTPELLWAEEAANQPDAVEPLFALGRYQSVLAQMAPTDNVQNREKAFTAASAAWKVVLERVPGDTEAEKNLGLAALNLGNLEEARTLLESATAQWPEDQELALYLAYALEQSGRAGDQHEYLVGALRAYRRAARLGVLPLEAQGRYGLLAASFGDLDTGLPLMTTAAGTDDQSPLKAPLEQFNTMAQQLQALRQRAETASSQNPGGVEAAFIRADSLLMEGRLMTAFYLLQSAMAQSPGNDAAWATLGMISARLGGSQNFLSDWGSSRMGNIAAWEQLAGRCAMTGNWEAAETYLRHGFSGDPGAMPELKLAAIALQARQPERAVTYFEAAQKAYPDRSLPWLQLADMYIAAQDFARARGQLDEAEKRGATQEEISARREKLGSGQNSVPTGIQRTVIR